MKPIVLLLFAIMFSEFQSANIPDEVYAIAKGGE